MIKNILLLLIIINFTCAISQVTSFSDGNYSNNASWIGNSPNAINDNVLILHNINLDVDVIIQQNFEIQGLLFGNSAMRITVNNNGNLIIGNLNIDDRLRIENNGNLHINAGDTVYVKDLEVRNNGTVTVESGAVIYVSNDFKLKDNASFILQSGAEIHVGDDFKVQDNASIIVDGDIFVTDKFEIKNNGSITGSGSITAGAVTKIKDNTNVFGNTVPCTDCVYSLGCSYSATKTIWTGNANNNWFSNTNWSDGVPSSSVQTIIPAGAPIYPFISGSGAECFHLSIESGASLDVTGTNLLDIHGDLNIAGTFNCNQSTINFNGGCWPTKLSCTGNVQFYSIVVNNTNNVEITNGSCGITGVLSVIGGSLITNDSLTIVSNAGGTGSISAITGIGISGEISMERYIDAGETYWRYFSSAVQGATIFDYQDDFTTAGYAGSAFPNFGWTSIYTYDETLGAGLGYLPVSSSGQVLLPGQGFQVWSGDTITGTQPFTVDLRGVPNQGDISIPVTFTNNGIASEDGWNFVGNPYPSTIDWDASAWTKTNMANAVYILNPDTEQYATYVNGASVNGGSRYIASQQSFWVYATASNPQLVAKEAVKSTNDQAFFKAGIEEALTGMKIRLSGNDKFDETVIRNHENATENFDFDFDAKKIWGGWGNYPQLSLLDDNNEDLTIHSFKSIDEDKVIPLRAVVFENGIYEILFENISNLDVNCLRLRDTYTGLIYNVEDGEGLQFEMYDTTFSPRFELLLGKEYKSRQIDNTCLNSTNGEYMLYLNKEIVNYVLTTSSTTIEVTDLANPLKISNLKQGNYSLSIPELTNSCGVTSFNFTIDAPAQLSVMDNLTPSINGSEGNIQLFPNGGTSPYQYEWNTGETTSAISNLAPNYYTVTITDANNCSFTKSFEIENTIIDTPEEEVISEESDELSYSYSQNQIIVSNSVLDGFNTLYLLNLNGKVVKTYSIDVIEGDFILTTPIDLSTGLYFLVNKSKKLTLKIIID